MLILKCITCIVECVLVGGTDPKIAFDSRSWAPFMVTQWWVSFGQAAMPEVQIEGVVVRLNGYHRNVSRFYLQF